MPRHKWSWVTEECQLVAGSAINSSLKIGGELWFRHHIIPCSVDGWTWNDLKHVWNVVKPIPRLRLLTLVSPVLRWPFWAAAAPLEQWSNDKKKGMLQPMVSFPWRSLRAVCCVDKPRRIWVQMIGQNGWLNAWILYGAAYGKFIGTTAVTHSHPIRQLASPAACPRLCSWRCQTRTGPKSLPGSGSRILESLSRIQSFYFLRFTCCLENKAFDQGALTWIQPFHFMLICLETCCRNIKCLS